MSESLPLENQEIEKQLSCPDGENGIEMGQLMNETNIGMTKSSIESLDLKDQNKILELGHGNCDHLNLILNSKKEVAYYGLEISETMYSEAKSLNKNTSAKFHLYDGINIPFEDNSFDRIMTVNTIYFWSDYEALLNEIERVLKPGGSFILTYADESFMKNLPFVGNRFRLFNKNKIQDLISSKSNLEIAEFKDYNDQMTSKLGDRVSRHYTVAKIKKIVL